MARRPQKPDEPSLLDQLSGPLRDFVQDFKTHGKSVLEKVRERSPEKYLELSTKLAGLVALVKPKPNEINEASTMEEVGRSLLQSVGCADEMTDEMIAQAIEANDEFVDRLEEIASSAVRHVPKRESTQDERKAVIRHLERTTGLPR